ncbi:MAG: S41 family peptidase [Anaerolineae bacterium]|nr:S41 family peptidase [Anaerolineae bacterium]
MDNQRGARSRFSYIQIGLMFVVIFFVGFMMGSQTAATVAQSLDTTPPADATTVFEPFWQVYNLIEDQYVDPNNQPVTQAELVDGAISGMINALGDEFSGYMPPDVYQMQNEYLEGEFEGIGATIRTIEDEGGSVEVVSVFPGSPAESAGIIAGDIFVAVNGEEVAGLTQSEIAFKVRGPEGTDVQITMRRDDDLIDFTLTRARIEIPNIEAHVEDGNIGYVRLYQFTADARQQLDEALTEIDANNRDGLILDLRGNPGGLLNSAIDIASAFVDDSTVLIEDFGPDREPLTLETNGTYQGLDVPLVLLVDEGSASASELVAGALQDLGRATIIGETTFGKGTVQTWRELVNGAGVRLTIARWKTPDGHWIHSQGIKPDIEVIVNNGAVANDEGTLDEPDTDLQLDAAIEFLSAQVQAVK